MNSQKQNRHSLMAKGIMVLLSLLVLIFIFTLAWFMDANAPATASGLSINTSTNADFDMAIGFTTPLTGNTYLVSDFTNSTSTHIDFEKIKVTKDYQIGQGNGAVTLNQDIAQTGEYSLLSDFKPIDLTGNGADKLYRPEMRSKNIAIDYTASRVDKNITPNRQYISFDLYTRSTKQDFTIHLDKGSYVVGAAEVQNVEDVSNITNKPSVTDISPANLKGGNVVRKSTYGDFSEDAVVGAVRVAFTQYTLPAQPTLSDIFSSQTANPLNTNSAHLWIPRSDFYLQDAANGGITGWSMYSSGDSGWSSAAQFNVDEEFGKAMNLYGTQDTRTVTRSQAAAEHWFYDESKISQTDKYARYTQVTSNVITDIEDADDTIIINGISNVFDGTYYYGKCRVNLWIEGCDAEARKAINGGSFFFGFDLSAR